MILSANTVIKQKLSGFLGRPLEPKVCFSVVSATTSISCVADAQAG